MKKKLFSLILVLCMMLTLVPLTASAATSNQADLFVAWAQQFVGYTKTGGQGAWFVRECAKNVGMDSRQINQTASLASPFVGNKQFGFITTSGVPQYGCQAFTWKDLSSGAYKPQKGDIVFYGYFTNTSSGTAGMTIKQVASNGKYSHVQCGIIRDNNSGKSVLYTIEGGQGDNHTGVSYKERRPDSNGKLSGWVDGKQVYVMEFVRPYFVPDSNFTFNANGGSGTYTATVKGAEYINVPTSSTITRKYYTLNGFYCQRSDGKWITNESGWRTDSEMSRNGYTKKLYTPGGSYWFNISWATDYPANPSYTFYAQWTYSHSHNYNNRTVVTAPTCTAQGYTTHYCECGASKVDTYKAATGHNYSYAVVTAPTETTTGVLRGTCQNKGCNSTVDSVIPVIASYDDYDYEVITNPTCTEKGLGEYTNKTDKNIHFTEEIAELGHAETVLANEKAPTCTEQGWTGDQVCSRCFTVLVPGEPIEATGHDYVYTVITPPTTEAEGVLEGVCTEGDDTVQLPLPKLSFDPDDPVWSYEVTKQPTCQETGTAVFTLKGTEYGVVSFIVVLPKVPHNYTGETIVVTAPTTTSEGLAKVKCLWCDSTKDVTIPKIDPGLEPGPDPDPNPDPNNEWEYSVALKPTCTEEGIGTYTLKSTEYGLISFDVTLKALGHNTHIINQKDATATKDGYTGDEFCSRCEQIIDYGKTIPATGSSPSFFQKLINSILGIFKNIFFCC